MVWVDLTLVMTQKRGNENARFSFEFFSGEFLVTAGRGRSEIRRVRRTALPACLSRSPKVISGAQSIALRGAMLRAPSPSMWKLLLAIALTDVSAARHLARAVLEFKDSLRIVFQLVWTRWKHCPTESFRLNPTSCPDAGWLPGIASHPDRAARPWPRCCSGCARFLFPFAVA
jgi:hypothetical protein